MPTERFNTSHMKDEPDPTENVSWERLVVQWGSAGKDHRERQLGEGSVGLHVETRTQGPDASGVEPGPHVCLDRRGINDLIRTLRRARDQAYGRDE